jgi:hypothetical protein
MPSRNKEPSEFAKSITERADELTQRIKSGIKSAVCEAPEKGYNGWKNYETWAVALWIDNEERTQNEARAIIREYPARNDAAQEFKEWIEAGNPLANASSLFSDLLGAALSEVDWFEIVEHFSEE